MINLIRSLHDGMKTEVALSGGETTPEIEVNNGLRQGCTIAPTLFNLYFNMVIMCWRERSQLFGVDILYKRGGKLIGEGTRSPSSLSVTELLFADDAAAVSTTRESMKRAAQALEEVTSEWGLSVSIAKTKLLVAGVDCEESDLQPINIRGGTEFKYLGSIMEANGSVQREVENRISKASRVFGVLKRLVFAGKDLSLATKRLLYRAIVLGVLLYGAETWPAKRDNSRKLEVFHNRCLRSILGISTSCQRSKRISSVQVSQIFGMRNPWKTMYQQADYAG